MHPTPRNVIVVGAGPTGLLLAGDLATAGIDVTLLERRDHAVCNLTRAFVVHARTLEQFDVRGIADELIADGHRLEKVRLFDGTALEPRRLRSRFPFILFTPQYEVERLLARRAEKARATILYGAEAESVDQDGDGIEVRVRTDDGRLTTHRAAYLVGTDGAHSTVRRSLGVPFPGRSVVSSLVLADVRLSRELPRPLTVNAVRGSFAFIGSFGDGWYRVVGWNRDRQAPRPRPRRPRRGPRTHPARARHRLRYA